MGGVIGKAMFRRLLDLVTAVDARNQSVALASDPRLATAALLVEAALMDERFESVERQQIESLLERRFELEPGEAEALVEQAAEQVKSSSQLFGFTRTVNEHFDHDQRVGLVEMLWQVVYADGSLDDYEANLMRRIAGLIHVSDRESGAARKRALAQLGIEG